MGGIFTDRHTTDYLNPGQSRPDESAAAGQVVAVYETNSAAGVARDALLAAGLGHGAVHLIPRAEGTGAERRRNFWSAVASLFAHAEYPAAYHLAADHDHALLVLTPTRQVDVPRAMQVLSSSHPLWMCPVFIPGRRAGVTSPSGG
ncbi:MAG TPA: hypothetical protein VE650_16575 [Acetobacteraceae bacterium]|jgi:hypothetical protein|nr:hypothetical protein [Acetobacteraceae bacterium]